MGAIHVSLCLLALFVASNAVVQGDETAQQTAEKLLTVLWDKQSNRSVEIPEIYQQSLQRVGRDPLLLHAYALNRIHFYRYRDALPVAEALSDVRPEWLESWLMRAWLNGILSRFDRMNVELQLLAQRFDSAANSGVYEDSELERFAARMGRMFGFLEGPAKNDVNPAALRDTQREIQRALGEDLFRIFDDERQNVLDQYIRAAHDRSQLLVQADHDWQIKSQQEIQQLDAADGQLHQRRDQVQQEITRLRDDGRQQLAEIDSRMRPLQSEGLAANRRLSSLEWSWQIVAQNLAVEEACLLREQDPLLRSMILGRIQQLQWQLRGIETDLFGLRGHVASLQQQLRTLELQRRSLANSLDVQLGTLQGEITQIQRTQRQNQTRRDKLVSGSAPVPTSARVIADQIKILATYDSFPTEVERQKLLQSMKQPVLLSR
ncbi:MAG TPA: hypothetical protein PKD54_06580 [Pirellulaceae bacterium]|nr:hypothetical protein [Pirellulaceae bacterium]